MCVCMSFHWLWFFEDLSNNARQLTVDTRRKNNVIMTSKRRRDVVWTSQCRYCCVMCIFVAHGLAHTWDCDCLVFTVILSAQGSAVWWPCKSRFIVFYHLSYLTSQYHIIRSTRVSNLPSRKTRYQCTYISIPGLLVTFKVQKKPGPQWECC